MTKTVASDKVTERDLEYVGVAGTMGIDPDHYPDVIRLEAQPIYPHYPWMDDRPVIYFFLICRIDAGAFYRSMMGTPLTVWDF